MLKQELKSQIDWLWNMFFANWLADPTTAIEQINYLIFMKRLDDIDQQNIIKANRLSSFKYSSVFEWNFEYWWRNYDKGTFRRSHRSQMPAEEMFIFVKDIVFSFIKNLPHADLFADSLKDSIFMIPNASLLVSAVSIIENLQITQQNDDTVWDIYEYLLNEIASAGKWWAFRTPRHIIQMIVELINPTKHDKICDPACWTWWFLINAYKYIIQQNTSKDAIFEDESWKHYPADLLDENDWKKLKSTCFSGYDFSTKMVRIALMNSILHGIWSPNITYTDTLWKEYSHTEEFDIILANPPFKWSVIKTNINQNFSLDTTKTELLFVELMLQKLVVWWRCGVIVPDGVLFGSSNAHKKLRELLVENTDLKAVISLPSWVFKPYAGVSTAVLVFTKWDETQKVWFYDLQADWFSLDDKRNAINDNDIPDVLKKYNEFVNARKYDIEPTKWEKRFRVDKEEIKKNNYDLSISKYKKIEYIPVKYEDPKVLISQIKEIENQIKDWLNEVEKLLENK